jgi:Lipase (class 3).
MSLLPQCSGHVRSIVFSLLVAVALASSGSAGAADGLDSARPAELDLFLALAVACEQAYGDSPEGLIVTPSGCALRTHVDRYGNLIIAFRGSMIGDRNPRHPFSSFGGANMRRNYRDWAATNLKQAFGFLPRQHTDAIPVLEELILNHPPGKYVFVTGHSKGGGAATYASVAVRYSERLSPEHLRRVRTVTFNASVVREQNWRRFFRRLESDVDMAEREPPAGSILALCMRDDPVSRITAGEERNYVRRITIAPSAVLTPNEQHGIQVVIDELEKRRALIHN